MFVLFPQKAMCSWCLKWYLQLWLKSLLFPLFQEYVAGNFLAAQCVPLIPLSPPLRPVNILSPLPLNVPWTTCQLVPSFCLSHQSRPSTLTPRLSFSDLLPTSLYITSLGRRQLLSFLLLCSLSPYGSAIWLPRYHTPGSSFSPLPCSTAMDPLPVSLKCQHFQSFG